MASPPISSIATTLANDGIAITFDPNIRPAFFDSREQYLPRFEETLKACDLMKLSDEDMEWLYPGAEIEAQAQKVFEAEDLGLLILTKGGDGAIVFSKQEALRQATIDQIEVVLTLAAKAAAINCGRKGCNPPTALELHS